MSILSDACPSLSINQIRGFLYEFNLLIPKGIANIRSLSLDNIPEIIRPYIQDFLEEFKYKDKQVKRNDLQIQRYVKQHPVGKQLLAVPGYGYINTYTSLIVDPTPFKNGRHYAAYLGCVPKQSGTGGKTKTQGISKRGNIYHRQLLHHGARAFLNSSKDYDNPLLKWAMNIKIKRGHNIAVAALANKLARISWHVLKGDTFCLDKTTQMKTN